MITPAGLRQPLVTSSVGKAGLVPRDRKGGLGPGSGGSQSQLLLHCWQSWVSGPHVMAALVQSLESKCSDTFAKTWFCCDVHQSDWWVCLSEETTDSCGYSELHAMSCVVVHRRTHRRALEKQQIIYRRYSENHWKSCRKGLWAQLPENVSKPHSRTWSALGSWRQA